jgi:hypothetical protein
MENEQVFKQIEAALHEKYYLITRAKFLGYVIAAVVIAIVLVAGLARLYTNLGKASSLLREVQRDKAVASLPVGSIIAWHKDMDTTKQLLLPTNQVWVECNGQTIDNGTYPHLPSAKITVPNLNGDQKFLRGNVKSGIMQPDDLKSHNHLLTTDGKEFYFISTPNGAGVRGRNYEKVRGAHNYHAIKETSPIGGRETRPTNMSVVWIMRVQ